MTFKKNNSPWNKGLTKETDIRMKKISEHIISIGGFNRGKSPWNKGLPREQQPCSGRKLVFSNESKLKMRNSHLGVKLSDEKRKSIR